MLCDLTDDLWLVRYLKLWLVSDRNHDFWQVIGEWLKSLFFRDLEILCLRKSFWKHHKGNIFHKESTTAFRKNPQIFLASGRIIVWNFIYHFVPITAPPPKWWNFYNETTKTKIRIFFSALQPFFFKGGFVCLQVVCRNTRVNLKKITPLIIKVDTYDNHQPIESHWKKYIA